MTIGRSNGAQGFTLIEVMVASFVVLTGLGAALVTFTAMARTARLTAAASEALHRARANAEELQLRTFADEALAEGSHAMSGGYYVVEPYAGHSTSRRVTLYQRYPKPDGTTTQLVLTTVLTSVLHK